MILYPVRNTKLAFWHLQCLAELYRMRLMASDKWIIKYIMKKELKIYKISIEVKIAKLLTHCKLDGWMDEWMSCDRKRPSQKLTCDILTIWPKMGKREKYNWHFSTLQSKIKNNNFFELEKVYRNELEQKTIEGWSFLL